MNAAIGTNGFRHGAIISFIDGYGLSATRRTTAASLPAGRWRPSGPRAVSGVGVRRTKPYELTELGGQFVHAAMNELVARLGDGAAPEPSPQSDGSPSS
jgi:hypothetical protein